MQLQGLKEGMRLEAKDRKNPMLTCVATISAVRDGKLLIHFDGWGNNYDYWCDVDSTDIHPVGWCKSKDLGQKLQKPKGIIILLSYIILLPRSFTHSLTHTDFLYHCSV